MSKLKRGISWYFQVFGICRSSTIDIPFKIKIAIFAERYPFFYWHRTTSVKIAFLADFENDGWEEMKYMAQKASSVAIVR